MSRFKFIWGLGIALACSLCVSTTSAQQFDPGQFQLIEETAASICNTVREAKGRKNEVQLQGEVNTKMGGLIGKVVDVGGSGEGSVTGEQFEGLSREATASALEGDRGCRERVFKMMLDKFPPRNQAPQEHPPQAPPRHFLLMANRDIYGHDIDKNGVFEKTESGRQKFCEANNACVAFVLDRWNHKCYLKDKIATTLVSARSVIGVNAAQVPTTPDTETKINIRNKRRFDGTPIERIRVSSRNKCRDLCKKEESCVAFTFFLRSVIGEDNCLIFDETKTEYMPDNTADSGWKEQSP